MEFFSWSLFYLKAWYPFVFLLVLTGVVLAYDVLSNPPGFRKNVAKFEAIISVVPFLFMGIFELIRFLLSRTNPYAGLPFLYINYLLSFIFAIGYITWKPKVDPRKEKGLIRKY